MRMRMQIRIPFRVPNATMNMREYVRTLCGTWLGWATAGDRQRQRACCVPRAPCCVLRVCNRQTASATKCVELWTPNNYYRLRSRVMNGGTQVPSGPTATTPPLALARLDHSPCNRYLVLNECGARYAPGTCLLLHIEFTYVSRLHCKWKYPACVKGCMEIQLNLTLLLMIRF